ncbi:hypothetical protein [Salinifilum ghardaiensis]
MSPLCPDLALLLLTAGVSAVFFLVVVLVPMRCEPDVAERPVRPRPPVFDPAEMERRLRAEQAHRQTVCARYLAQRRDRILAAEPRPYVGKHRLAEDERPAPVDITPHRPPVDVRFAHRGFVHGDSAHRPPALR